VAFTVDSPTRYDYVDTRDAPAAISAVEADALAVARSLRETVDRQTVFPAPTGYRITHVFQVADDDGKPEDLQYVESMDVETWEHITPTIEVMLTRTRTEGWTVSITVAQTNLLGEAVDDRGLRAFSSPAR
jgi:hypothetical protein